MVVFQLQRFAGEKTERATPQRRREAREKGQIPRSADLTSAITLVAVVSVLRVLGSQIWGQWLQMMQQGLSNLSGNDLTRTELSGLMVHQVLLAAKFLAPLLAVALVIGVASAVSQSGALFLPNKLLPDFTKVNPIEGFKRMFSMRTGVEAIKSVLKLTAVGLLSYMALHSIIGHVEELVSVDIHAFPGVIGGMVWQLAMEVAVFMLVLALVDLLYQRFEFEKSIRMSKDDIKEEMKRMEGNQQIKARIRQRGRDLAMRRMMQDVPKADVVITNPTHYAVALRYDAEVSSAPIVLAKGVDAVAQRIKTIASESSVPVVENRPLAQTLYKTVDVGQAIPTDLYKAVAEILAYVYRRRNQTMGGD